MKKVIVSLIVTFCAVVAANAQRFAMVELTTGKPLMTGGNKEMMGIQSLKQMAGVRAGLGMFLAPDGNMENFYGSLRFTYLFPREIEIAEVPVSANGDGFDIGGSAKLSYYNIMPQIGGWGLTEAPLKSIFLVGMGVSWSKLKYDFEDVDIDTLIFERAPWRASNLQKDTKGQVYCMRPGFMFSYGLTYQREQFEIYGLVDLQIAFGPFPPFVPAFTVGAKFHVNSFNFVEK